MSNDLASQEILIVELGKDDTPAAFQARIERSVGVIAGELLTWLDGSSCYLPGGLEAMLMQRAPAMSVEKLFKNARAANLTRVPFAELAMRMDQRSNKKAFLRDANAEGIALPGVAGATVVANGREVKLDWQLTVSGIHAAWGLFAATPGALPWRNIRIGHIDTGCTRSPALGFHDGISDYVRADLGNNYFSDFLPRNLDLPSYDPPEETGPFDNLTGGNGGHGTRTLSVLAGFFDTPDHSEPPFYGAAPGASVVPYRVTNSVLIDHVQRLIVLAIDDAIAKKCRIISMSMGGIVRYDRLAEAIDRAYEAGLIVCAAAGNVISEVTYPGRYNRVVTVGGVSPVGETGYERWEGASRGEYVDICGPANEVRRASIEWRDGELVPFVKSGGDGTSYATALCAGIAALWLSKRKGDLVAAYGTPNWRWPAAFKRLLKETADRPAGWDTQNWGRGLYQADALLKASLPAADGLQKEAAAMAAFDPLA